MMYERGKLGKALEKFGSSSDFPSMEERRNAWENKPMSESQKRAEKNNNRVMAAFLITAVLFAGGGVYGASKAHEQEQREADAIEKPACATSPKAQSGDTEWSLARQVYPNLDALAKRVVSVETSSQDGILRPNDTVEVCVPLDAVALANKPTN